jgi:hypothetical protein
MLDKVLGSLGGLFGLIDDIHTSDEEKLTVKSALLGLQMDVVSTVIEAERDVSMARSEIIKAEAQSSHFLTSTWRPITMLTFLVLIVASQLGFTDPVPEQMWPLLQLGIGGYVAGRSLEKTVPAVVSALKAREEV